jgi:hypothetical protein
MLSICARVLPAPQMTSGTLVRAAAMIHAVLASARVAHSMASAIERCAISPEFECAITSRL